jgi:hypothetical protein
LKYGIFMLCDQEEDVKSEPAEEVVVHVKGQESLLHHHTDHDYTAIYGQNIKLEPGNPGRAWIDEDAPPLVR